MSVVGGSEWKVDLGMSGMRSRICYRLCQWQENHAPGEIDDIGARDDVPRAHMLSTSREQWQVDLGYVSMSMMCICYRLRWSTKKWTYGMSVAV